MLTELLATDSNRPEFSFIEAGRGSLHWTHLLSLVFPDLFGAMDRKVDFWGAGGFAWNERFGMADLFLAQNMGLLYAGALVPLMLIAGCVRGWLWSREMRFFTIAALFTAFYVFGWYTPVFRGMYELMPGVKLFRRPADATFVFGALIAILAGYRAASLARPRCGVNRVQRMARADRHSSPSWRRRSGSPKRRSASSTAVTPLLTGLCFVAAAFIVLLDRARPLGRSPRWCCSPRSRPPISPSTTRRMN